MTFVLENQNVTAKYTSTADRKIIYAKGTAFRKYESVETLYIHVYCSDA